MEVEREISEHLQKHILYPTTKNAIIEACNKMMDVQQSDRDYFERCLPDWTYNNADEVIRAVQVSEHLDRVTYPTTKRELLKAYNKMSDIPKSYKEWFERYLPDRTYDNPDDVIKAFRM